MLLTVILKSHLQVIPMTIIRRGGGQRRGAGHRRGAGEVLGPGNDHSESSSHDSVSGLDSDAIASDGDRDPHDGGRGGRCGTWRTVRIAPRGTPRTAPRAALRTAARSARIAPPGTPRDAAALMADAVAGTDADSSSSSDESIIDMKVPPWDYRDYPDHPDHPRRVGRGGGRRGGGRGRGGSRRGGGRAPRDARRCGRRGGGRAGGPDSDPGTGDSDSGFSSGEVPTLMDDSEFSSSVYELSASGSLHSGSESDSEFTDPGVDHSQLDTEDSAESSGAESILSSRAKLNSQPKVL